MDDEELLPPEDTLESSLQVIEIVHEVRPVQTERLVLETSKRLLERCRRIAQPMPRMNSSGGEG